jgi:hypothetical protein
VDFATANGVAVGVHTVVTPTGMYFQSEGNIKNEREQRSSRIFVKEHPRNCHGEIRVGIRDPTSAETRSVPRS